MEAQPTRFFSQETVPALREAAKVLARFVGVQGEDLVFVPNATTGCNAVLRSLRFEPDDEILYASHIYNAVRNTVIHVASGTGAKMVVAEIPYPQPDDATILRNVERAITRRTRLAVFDHITSSSGLILPLAGMIALCHAAGVPVLVDGAHGPGQVPLDLATLGADWYVGNCHKWLSGPKGSAFLHARADRREGLHPGTISHGYGDGFTAEFDWPGTVDPTAYLAVPAAIAFFERLGGTALMERNRSLVTEAAKMLADRLGTEVGGPFEMTGSMAMVRLPTDLKPELAESNRIRQALRNAGADSPVHPLPGALWLRLSAYAYNEMADYERLAKLLPGVLASVGN
jgi:isopenicillin-N epimerase